MKKRRNSTSSTISCKKRRRKEPEDALLSTCQYLHLKDVSSSSSLKAPWLTLPPEEEDKFNNRSSSGSCRFKNIEENIIYTMKKSTSDMLLKFPCIGSSQGWLILLDVSTFSPLLFNPLTEDQIKLPSVKSLFNISKIYQADEEGCYIVSRVHREDLLDKDFIRSCMIPKAILTAEPELKGEYSVVLIYEDHGVESKLGFYKNGDESWIELSSIKFLDYEDIICFNNKLYALSSNSNIHTWDLQNFSPDKCVVINPSFLKDRDFRYGYCTMRSYLVESKGEIMLVDRFVSEEFEDLVHTTKHFWVYKLDSSKKKNQWVAVHSLGDQSLFLGGNHSVSVLTKGFKICRRNSIYFTDDSWHLMTNESDYYGHDNGVFSLRTGSICPVFGFKSANVQPLPCWIMPN